MRLTTAPTIDGQLLQVTGAAIEMRDEWHRTGFVRRTIMRAVSPGLMGAVHETAYAAEQAETKMRGDRAWTGWLDQWRLSSRPRA